MTVPNDFRSRPSCRREKCREIRIAVALIVRENGDTLLVRKRGMPDYLQSGGKIEGGNTEGGTGAGDAQRNSA